MNSQVKMDNKKIYGLLAGLLFGLIIGVGYYFFNLKRIEAAKIESIKCSNPETIAGIKGRVFSAVKDRVRVSEDKFVTLIEIYVPTPTSFDEKIMRYECSASLRFGEVKTGIGYMSQMDDNGSHVYGLKGMFNTDFDELVSAVNSLEESFKKNTTQVVEKLEQPKTIFLKLQDTPFTANLVGDNESVLQIEIMLEVNKSEDKNAIENKKPLIVSSINSLLRSKSLEEVKTTNGQKDLAIEIRNLINKIINAQGEDAGVLTVNFTKYFYQ